MSISSIVDLAVGKIGEILANEAKLLFGVRDEVRSLQEELITMNAYFTYLESMYEEEANGLGRTAIKQIRKIVYDAEDVIESYILEASSSADKKENLLKRYLCFCTSLPQTHQIGSEIEDIKTRWENLKDDYNIKIDLTGENNNLRQGLSKTRARTRPVTYSHTYEDLVVGLDEDICKLVGVLTADEGTKFRVVTIVGMGGSGKTTITRKLFNHETVKRHFGCLAWVSVSQQWDAEEILLSVLHKVGMETPRMGEFPRHLLVEKLHEDLKRKNCLIVLDDVWEEKALDDIFKALPLENYGSKIIVTTRRKNVVDYPNINPRTYQHEPRRLIDDESWELFRKIALIHREETSSSMNIARLEALGKEMLKKCKGLPLAVIALAGILQDKETLEGWNKISKAVSSRIMEDGKGTHLYGQVDQMLALSYSDLPRDLKPCFLYLARYPEDCKISVGRLIRLWVAEGFFTTAKKHEGETIEDVACRYLDELVNRCLVQVASRNYEGKIKTIQMHDLVRDLCIKMAKEEDFLEVFTSKNLDSDTKVAEPRRAAIISSDRVSIPLPTTSQHLRSLEYEETCYDIGRQSLRLQLIHKNFRLLRVLLLVGIQTSDNTLPKEIGSLIHLRYLGLWRTDIEKLPSSIGNLRNLLILECNSMDGVRIPNVLWRIKGLRHLIIKDYNTIDLKLKLQTLRYLQTLKGVNGGNWMLKELPLLSPTLQKLAILEIRSQEQLEAAFQCPSIRADTLHSLSLSWLQLYSQPVELGNLEPIMHSQHLKKLSLTGAMADGLGTQFPDSIKKLVLGSTYLKEEATLVALGKLPQLTILNLGYESYVGTKWTCIAGDFPELKELGLSFLKNIEEWSIEMGAMPQLSKLVIFNCKKLIKLPEGLKFITTLQEFNVDSIPPVAFKSTTNAHIVQHVPLGNYKRYLPMDPMN